MTVLSNIALYASVAALGVTAGGVALTATAPEPTGFVAPEPAGVAVELAAAPTLSPQWPEVFGTVPPPAPDPEPAPEPVAAPAPEPAPQPAPEPEPEIRYDYVLAGIVAGDREGWALVSAGGLQQLIRVGDELDGGEIVERIDDKGVWITWRGLPQLIPVYRTDSSLFMTITPTEPAAPPETLGEVDVTIERMDRRFLQRTFEAAGRLVMTDEDDGTSALDVVWIRQGELYERIGLRTGDKILRINGSMVENPDLLAHLPDAITQGGTIDLEILRDGTRQIIKVNLGQG